MKKTIKLMLVCFATTLSASNAYSNLLEANLSVKIEGYFIVSDTAVLVTIKNISSQYLVFNDDEMFFISDSNESVFSVFNCCLECDIAPYMGEYSFSSLKILRPDEVTSVYIRRPYPENERVRYGDLSKFNLSFRFEYVLVNFYMGSKKKDVFLNKLDEVKKVREEISRGKYEIMITNYFFYIKNFEESDLVVQMSKRE